MHYQEDTIAAIATAPGNGAIAVIRLSGPDSVPIADALFRGNHLLQSSNGFSLHHGALVDAGGAVVDEVLVSVFRSPHSYTGENSIEISCHGGQFVTKRILELVCEAGARQAEPGEFTKRAFLNGKMDLSQAEAVADLISAQNDRGYRISLSQLEGKFGKGIEDLRKGLVEVASLLELELDFSDEDIELVSREEILNRLELVRVKLEAMVASFNFGKICREGVKVAIVGNPNAGKSSLFNALLQEDRAIVTPIPGTTRDSLEEHIAISGISFKLLDTAGLRETSDQIETEGIRRTLRHVEQADMVILVRDASEILTNEEPESYLNGFNFASKNIIEVLNKIDLVGSELRSRLGKPSSKFSRSVQVSALRGTGIDLLRSQMFDLVAGQFDDGQETEVVSSGRHVNSLERSVAHLVNAISTLSSGSPLELVAIDIREASRSLSEITGEITTDDMLNSIFQNFCIGK